MRTLPAAAASMIAVIALGACSADQPASTPPTAAAPSAAAADVEAFLAAHDLAGKSVTEIVDALDATNDDRESGPFGSVRSGELILADDRSEVALPIEDAFYLSIAPYVNQTHECYNHSLSGCQGELVDTDLDVTIVGADGTEIFAGDRTTGPNGFAGFWLPRDIDATITITADGRSATTRIGTGADDPTCLTTMQLG